jgi:CheY-like chemotaxis protein
MLPALAFQERIIDPKSDDFELHQSADRNKKISNCVRILLVEDDEDSREMLRLMFEQHGMKITSVASAAEGLQAIEQIKPDVLISDIGLPNEDGYELIRKVRLLTPEQGGLTPAIALTGYVSLQDRNHAFNVGYQEHLSKPVDIDKLLDLVEKLVDSHKSDGNT